MAISQSAGLGAKLDAAEKKLDQDIKACRPIDVNDYQTLSIDAYRNAMAAVNAGRAGAPIDATQVNADLARAKALFDRAKAAADKACPPPQQSPKNAGPPETKAETPGPAAESQKPKPKPTEPEKPKPPEHSIVEDLVEPPTPAELKEIEKVIRELEKTTRAYPHLLEGCQPAIWDKHIAQLEALAKRARQIAEWAKAPGQRTGVDPKDAQRVADEAQRAVDDAKREKAANLEKWRVPQCPNYQLPRSPFGNSTSPLPNQLDSFNTRLLAIQNQERATYHLQPLRWNFQLQQDATTWAQTMARTGQLVHAPRQGRGIARENLQRGLTGWGPDRLMKDWISEKRYFHPGFFPNVCTGEWTQCAHYSQIIWPTTTDIGCGMATGGGFIWLDCRYSPGGNKDGKPVGLSYRPERG